ncbi:MAG: WG repeat-containing protein, partial [Cytophagales bacterium]
KYDKAEDFVNGFAKVQIGEALGFIDSTGKEITEVKFIRLRNFQEGFATASLEDIGRTGFIDKNGKSSSRFYFDNAGSYNEGLAWVELKGKVGFLNKNGDEVIKPKYDFVTDFLKSYAIVSKKQLYGCVDKNGKEFVPIEYPKVKRYSPDSSLVLVMNKMGKYGIYNRVGKALIPEYFVKITDFQNYGGQLLAEVSRVQGEVFFYINEKAQCVEFDAKVCPEE